MRLSPCSLQADRKPARSPECPQHAPEHQTSTATQDPPASNAIPLGNSLACIAPAQPPNTPQRAPTEHAPAHSPCPSDKEFALPAWPGMPSPPHPRLRSPTPDYHSITLQRFEPSSWTSRQTLHHFFSALRPMCHPGLSSNLLTNIEFDTHRHNSCLQKEKSALLTNLGRTPGAVTDSGSRVRLGWWSSCHPRSRNLPHWPWLCPRSSCPCICR